MLMKYYEAKHSQRFWNGYWIQLYRVPFKATA